MGDLRTGRGPKRAFAALLVALLVPWVGMGPAPAAAAAGPDSFAFAGSGLGHGVGLSQQGAFSQALDGRSAPEILGHYFSGTTVGPVDDTAAVRVNLLESVASADLRGEAVGAGGGIIKVSGDRGGFDAAPNEPVHLTVTGSNVVASKSGSTPVMDDVVRVQWSGPTVVDVVGPGETFEEVGHRYRYGEIDVAVVDGALQVVNTMRVHSEYLRGVAEMPAGWPAEALHAQAIASRSMALRRIREGQRPSCRCHLVDTIGDQIFAGWTRESGPDGARWVAAVAATSPGASSGLVVLAGGEVASTFFFASSGGRTESNVDGFGSSSEVSYLRSVEDRGSLSSSNPLSAWTFTRSQQVVRDAFNRDLPPSQRLADVASIDLTARTTGGSVRTAVAVATNGVKATLPGATFRARLDLPSRWVGTPVVRVAGPNRFATSVAAGRVASAGGSTVVVASGEAAHLVDGLVAAPLARLRQAPLLLATADALPGPAGDEVARRRATTALLIGGTGALGPAVESGLRDRGVTTIRRLSGPTRYDTGLAVAREMGAPRTLAVVASGDPGHLVDALAAGGPAAGTARPILLVSRDQVPLPTRQALTELGVTSTVVAGGPSAVSDSTMAQLPNPRRLAGADRYTTAVAVADHFLEVLGADEVAIGSGADGGLVDSLTGGAIGSVTLLTAPGALTPQTRSWLTRVGPDVGLVHVLGGSAAVSDAAFDAVRGVVYP